MKTICVTINYSEPHLSTDLMELDFLKQCEWEHETTMDYMILLCKIVAFIFLDEQNKIEVVRTLNEPFPVYVNPADEEVYSSAMDALSITHDQYLKDMGDIFDAPETPQIQQGTYSDENPDENRDCEDRDPDCTISTGNP